jgi:hypothetical protein
MFLAQKYRAFQIERRLPLISTRCPFSSQRTSPPRADTWRANSVDFPSFSLQYGISMVCDEPVTGSSQTATPGEKKRLTKSYSRCRAQ